MKKKTRIIAVLILIFSLALFVRIYFSYKTAFSDPVKYSADDGVYHMRVVENELLGNHFPKQITYDPFTYFPNGTFNNIAPLFDQMIAWTIWMISLGRPTKELIDKIAPFFPAVFGSLGVFIIYFLGKKLWNNNVIALVSSLLVGITPYYISRSALGITDTHVAEFMFFYLAIMFFAYSLAERKFFESKTENEKLDLKNVFKKELKYEKKFWFFTIITGLASGVFFWAWPGAPLLLFIIFVFSCSFFIINYFLGKRYDWILTQGILIFSIVLLMIFPFLNGYAKRYAIQYLGIILSAIAGFLILLIAGYLANKKSKRNLNFIINSLVSSFLVLGFIRLAFPYIFESLWNVFLAVNTSSDTFKYAKEVTGEMKPLGIGGVFNDFGYFFYISLFGLGMNIYEFCKHKKPQHLLISFLLVIFILLSGVFPFFGQGRFELYLCGAVSLLSSYAIAKGFGFGWRSLNMASRLEKNDKIRPYLLSGSLAIIFGIIFLIIYPFPVNMANSFPSNLPIVMEKTINIAKGSLFIREKGWYDSLLWLKDNTPDPKLDYYALYSPPAIKSGNVEPYSYSVGSYGVLARWDYGHLITYQAHRIPIANNFHQGIGVKEGGKVLEPGQGVFFLETEENLAKKYAEDLGARYIIIDHTSASANELFLSEVTQVYGSNSGDYFVGNEEDESPSKYDNSMAVRLYMLDGCETKTKRKVKGKIIDFNVKSLDYFRLVYESSESFASDINTGVDVKAVKVFEFVAGAKISGHAKPGSNVSISTTITTNQGREFEYKKELNVGIDGIFEFVVPYPTGKITANLEKETNTNVIAKPYSIKINDKETSVDVNQADVYEGKTIEAK